MTVAQLIPIAIQLSMGLIVFCVALHASFDDITFLVRRPGLLLRSLLTMHVVMPLFAVAVALLFDLDEALQVALVATAVAPVPPIAPDKQIEAGGESSYIIGLLAITAVLSIALVPAATELLARIFDRPAHVTPATVAKIVATGILLPLVAGVAFRLLAPSAAARIAKPLSVFATLLLVLAFVPVLIKEWPSLLALVGHFTIVAIIAFTLVGLAVGHLLGGPDPDERSVLALAAATRHPAVALAVTHNAPNQASVMAAVLLVLIVGAIVTTPYAKWSARRHAAAQPPQRMAAR